MRFDLFLILNGNGYRPQQVWAFRYKLLPDEKISELNAKVKAILQGLEGHAITDAQVRQTSRRIRAALLLQSQNNLLQAVRLAGDGLVIGNPDVDRVLLEAYAKLSVGEVRDAGKLLHRRAVRVYLGQ